MRKYPFARLLVVLIALVGGRLAADAADKAMTDAFNFAQGLYIHRDFTSAIEEFRAFLDAYPNAPQVAEARYRLADALFHERDFTAAAAVYGEALAKHPQHAEAGRGAYNLARSHYRREAFADALEAFRKAVAIGGDQLAEEATVGVGESLKRLEKFPEAALCYAEFVDRFPESDHLPNALFSLGWVHAQTGDQQAAATVLRQLLANHPNFAEIAKARLALSDALASLGQYEASAEALQPLVDDDDLQPDVLLRQAWNFFHGQRFAAAAEAFANFAANHGRHRLANSARFNAGIAFFKATQFAPAITHLQALLEAPDDQPLALQARYWLALSQFNLGDYAAAAENLAPLAGVVDGLTAEQRAGVVWHGARARTALGDPAAAVELYRDFLANRNPANQPEAEVVSTMTYALAVEQNAAGDTAAAVATLVDRLPAIPDGDLRDKALFALAEFYYRLGQPEAAAPLLEELVAATPQPPPKVLYRQAWVTFDGRQFGQAEALFRRLADGDSEFAAEARFMQARALEELDRPAPATAAYQAYLASPDERRWRQEAYSRLAFLLPVAERPANFDTYIRLFPEGRFIPEMRLKLAEDLFAQGRATEADQLYELAAAAEAPTVRRAATYGRAWVALKDRRDNVAAEHFEQVRRQRNDDDLGGDATLQLGEIAYRAGRFAEAAALFAELVDHPQAGQRASYMLAWSQRQNGEPAIAAETFAHLIQQWPEGEFATDAALRRAEILHRAGDSPAAVELLAHRRFAQSPWREEALHVLCEALVAVGDWRELVKQAENLRREFPESERRHLATFNLGRAYHELGLREPAETYYRQTIEETDTIEAAKAQFNLGALRFAEEKYAEAARLFLRVDMLYDYREVAAKALHHAADAFARDGDHQRAAMYRRRLRETHPESEWADKQQP